MKKAFKGAMIALAVTALVVATAAWYHNRKEDEAAVFKTAAVTQGDLLVTIGATGTVEPEEVIDVGAQVAGQILAFGKDTNGKTVDYGSHVAEGTVLARIDDSIYTAEEVNAEAQVQAAQAAQQRADADLKLSEAKMSQAERDWQRAKKIGPSEALSQTSYDAYQSAYESAQANIAVSRAAILQAKAGVIQADSVLKRARRNLSYCTIKSPVDGVIIDRRVNIGQTVVASLNAPSLFLIAKDLTRMQVWVAVNEADIGKIHPGQPVTFTVDAFPDETFKGSVGKIRLNASMTQNVVTYTVEIITDNKDGRLLPYLTANVQFELKQINDVLKVPNSALRWSPTPDQIAPEFRDAGESTARTDSNSPSQNQAEKRSGREHLHALWTMKGDFVRPLWVNTGISDGTMTAVSGKELTAGIPVVTGILAANARSNDTRNPFTPQFGRRKRSQSSH